MLRVVTDGSTVEEWTEGYYIENKLSRDIRLPSTKTKKLK